MDGAAAPKPKAKANAKAPPGEMMEDAFAHARRSTSLTRLRSNTTIVDMDPDAEQPDSEFDPEDLVKFI